MKHTLEARPGKPLLNRAVVAQVVGCLKPGIEALLELHGRKFLHLLVLSPMDRKTVLFDGPMTGAVDDYPRPYREIAIKKAMLAARTGVNTSEANGTCAHLLAEGDIVYQGGVNYRGLVVAASGAQGPVDEAVCLMVAAQLSAYCQVKSQELQKEAAKGGPYLVPRT